MGEFVFADVPVEEEESPESAFRPEEESSQEGAYLRQSWGMASTEEGSLEQESLCPPWGTASMEAASIPEVRSVRAFRELKSELAFPRRE